VQSLQGTFGCLPILREINRQWLPGYKNKRKIIKLKYNYSIVGDVSSNMPSTAPTQDSVGQTSSTYYFSKTINIHTVAEARQIK
jgi:hypothetical protein